MSTGPVPAVEEMRRSWFIFLLLGILLTFGGAAALAAPYVASSLVLIWGWFLIVRGVLELVGAFFARRLSTFLLHVLIGILAIVLGDLVIFHPEQAERALTLLIAAFFLVGGMSEVVAALYVRFPGWLFTLVAGVVGVLVGLMIWRDWPGNSAVILGLLVGIELVFRGASWIGFALGVKNLPSATV